MKKPTIKWLPLLLALLLAGCAGTGPPNPGGLLGASPYNPPIPPLNAEPAITAGTSLQCWRGDKTWHTLNPAAAGAEPAITAGTSLQYWRGDKTWQTLPLQVYPGAGVANSTGTAWGTSYMVGTAANNLVQLNASAQLPAVSGGNLTGLLLLSGGILTGNLVLPTATYTAMTSIGNSGTSKTINWTTSNIQTITTTGSCTLTFTAPAGPCILALQIVHEASTTAYTYTWPSSVKWPGGTAPATTNTSGAIDCVTFLFNGTNYLGFSGLNFQ